MQFKKSAPKEYQPHPDVIAFETRLKETTQIEDLGERLVALGKLSSEIDGSWNQVRRLSGREKGFSIGKWSAGFALLFGGIIAVVGTPLIGVIAALCIGSVGGAVCGFLSSLVTIKPFYSEVERTKHWGIKKEADKAKKEAWHANDIDISLAKSPFFQQAMEMADVRTAFDMAAKRRVVLVAEALGLDKPKDAPTSCL